MFHWRWVAGGSVGLLIVAVVAWFVVYPPAQGPPKIKIALVTWVGFGPFYVAQDKGYFREEGLNVQLVRIDDFGARRGAMAAGELDGSFETVDALAVCLAENLPAAAILVVDQSYGVDGIVANKGIANIAGLKGKTVACAKSTPSHFFLLYLLDQQGLSPRDFTFQPMEAGDAGAAFVAGKVDCAVTWEPWLSRAKTTPHGHVLATTKEYPGIIADTFVVHPRFAKNRPEDVKAILRAWFKATEYLRDHPAEAAAIMAKHLELPAEELDAMLDGIRFPSYEDNLAFFGVTGTDNQSEKMFSAAVSIWKNAGLIPEDKVLDPKSVYDLSFLRDLRK